MESPLTYSPVQSIHSGLPSRSRSSTKLGDDVTSLTSFNPFSEEDENDYSSYALVTSLFSRMKNSFAAPLTSSTLSPPPNGTLGALTGEQKRPSVASVNASAFSSRSSAPERPSSLTVVPSRTAPPLVSLTPVVSDPPSFGTELDRSPSRSGQYTPVYETPDGGLFGTAIPGFPIQDDARSIRTTASLNRSASVSKVIRRIRGEGRYTDPLLTASNTVAGLSRDYWMEDSNARECYDCKSVFTTWRRKHHCRICGVYPNFQIQTCRSSKCRPNILLALCIEYHQGFQVRS